MTQPETFESELDHEIRQVIQELGWLAGRPVALVVFREDDGTPSFMPHPVVGAEILAAMARVNWPALSARAAAAQG
jgi:hypothetical protein